MATKKVNLDESQRLDITVRRGDSFSLVITFKNSSGTALALTTLGYEWQMEVRTPQNNQSLSSMVLASSNTLGTTQLTSAGNVALLEDFVTDNDGKLTISAGYLAMKQVPQGVYVYDLQYKDQSTSPVTVKTVLRGNFIVNPDVTTSHS
mgnify:FL=1|tara:strand:+ start:393 stop:839 length:447 start_codon:yes stop_codon:yes gene_type:complete